MYLQAPIMRLEKNPPYVANFSKTSCQQAVYAMILQHFTGAAQSESDMDAMCNAKPGKWTWHFSAINKLANAGYQIVHVSDFDFREFGINPRAYLESFDGKENAKIACEKSDIESERMMALQLIEKERSGNISFELRSPEVSDIKRCLDEGYLISHWINSAALLGDFTSYTGHYVLPYDVFDDLVVFHNPGGYDKKGRPVNQCVGQMLDAGFFDRCVRSPDTGLSEGFTAIKPS